MSRPGKTISKSRVKRLLDPAHDPWRVTGDQPITFVGGSPDASTQDLS